MATYYKWRKSTIKWTESESSVSSYTGTSSQNDVIYYSNSQLPLSSSGTYSFSETENIPVSFRSDYYLGDSSKSSYIVTSSTDNGFIGIAKGSGTNIIFTPTNGVSNLIVRRAVASAGTSQGYVYSTSSSAYPNGGASGGYYYDQRTTVTSPTAPTALTYPSTITNPSVDVSWTASINNVPAYAVTGYEVSYAVNGESTWTVAGTPTGTSLTVAIPTTATSIQFRVRAQDSNNQRSSYATGSTSQVLIAPALTVPSLAMQGQNITVNWTAITGATSYTLQRKADTDDDWVQVYSGSNLTFTETVGAWTSVQYQVQAVFSSGAGGWATSGSIPVVSESALVISGTDSDLGTITADIPYTVSSDTGNDITLTRTVNGVQVASLTVESGFAYNIPVVDLPTGTGTIVISASVTASSGTVTATRTWTYAKTAMTFPNSAGIGQLSQNGQNIWPLTVPDAIKTPAYMGGNLGTALNQLSRAVLYNQNQIAKYAEVNINLANVSVGDEVNLPYNGVMVPHIVVQIGTPNAEIYDASCDGVWLLRKNIVENGQWNSSNVSTLNGSTIMATMQGYVANYDSTVQSAIQTVKIPYCVGNGSTTVNTLTNGLQCQVFPLGAYELGVTTDDYAYYPVDGSTLSYFQGISPNADPKRISQLNGIATAWWTRAPYTSNNNECFKVGVSGNLSGSAPNQQSGIRPCFIMPTTFTSTYLVDEAGNVGTEQEYISAGSYEDILGNTIPVPKIETGSYVGTGTYGVDNPNTLTFGFEPKFVAIVTLPSSTTSTSGLTTAIFVPQALTSEFSNRGYLVSQGNLYYGGLNLVPYSSTTNYYTNYAKIEGNTLSWYSSNVPVQLNSNNFIYNYVAIG